MLSTGVMFNKTNRRLGRLTLSRLGFVRMTQYGLATDMLEDTFRYGKEVEPGKLIYEYGDYSVGLLCEVDQTQVFRGDLTKVRVIIITCWRQWRL